jgi:peptidoglycan/LPS O-acetylase OafA/YrhL
MAADRHQSPLAHGGNARFQMLDVWRGVVCLVVVLEHVGVVLWGPAKVLPPGLDGSLRYRLVSALQWNFGSMLFFVMSGYCIASSLDATRRRGDSPVRFLYRRFWRIYPTYWVALLVFVGFVLATDAFGLGYLHNNGVSLSLDSPASLDRSQWLGNITLSETWRPRVAGSAYTAVFTRVAWSLCYQEQFYMLCALALWLTPGRLVKTLAVATVAIAGFRAAALDVGAYGYFQGMFTDYWHVFAVGLAVYWRLNMSAASPAWTRRAVELGLILMACNALVDGKVSVIAPYLFGLLLIGMHRWDGVAGNHEWLAPLRACGRRSFSIYLIHLPVTMVGNGVLVLAGLDAFWVRALLILPVVTAASVGVGFVFHSLVERHFMGQPPVLSGPSSGGTQRYLPFGGRLTAKAA